MLPYSSNYMVLLRIGCIFRKCYSRKGKYINSIIKYVKKQLNIRIDMEHTKRTSPLQAVPIQYTYTLKC